MLLITSSNILTRLSSCIKIWKKLSFFASISFKFAMEGKLRKDSPLKERSIPSRKYIFWFPALFSSENEKKKMKSKINFACLSPLKITVHDEWLISFHFFKFVSVMFFDCLCGCHRWDVSYYFFYVLHYGFVLKFHDIILSF